MAQVDAGQGGRWAGGGIAALRRWIDTDASAPAGDGGARWIDALGAYYVHGSSARGPMRAGNLPAFATREAAQAFAAPRGGTELAFGAIDAALIAELAGRGGHVHQH